MNVWPWQLLIGIELLLLAGVVWLYLKLNKWIATLQQQTEPALLGIQAKQTQIKRFRQKIDRLADKDLWQPQPRSWQGRLIWWVLSQAIQFTPTQPLKTE